jgi:hypothetical protein
MLVTNGCTVKLVTRLEAREREAAIFMLTTHLFLMIGNIYKLLRSVAIGSHAGFVWKLAACQ